MKYLSSIRFSQKLIIAVILLVALLMRWLLIFQGGQYYFSDEQRYLTSRAVVQYLLQGKVNDAVSQLFILPEHLGYKILGIFPALLEYWVGQSLVWPAMFFSLFSVFNLYLIFLLSKRMGGESNEALLALIISALCQSLFYYSRHLMPYDVAMSLGLLALYAALSTQQTIRISLTCGALGLLCFVTYNGYWALVGLALIAHTLCSSKSLTDIVRKGFFLAVGFFLPLLGLMGIAAWAGINLLAEYQDFVQTITQGYFPEDWGLPFAYFWHAEHFLFVALILLALFAVLNWKNYQTERVSFWGGCILFVYLCLIVPSVFLHKFVVYGRLARQIMPFLILLAATGLIKTARSGSLGYKLSLVILGVLVVQATWNFRVAYGVSYPKDFVKAVQAQYKAFSFSEKRFAFGAPVVCENSGYAMQNAKYFLDAPEETQPIPGTVLLSEVHPVNFLPYQYEGYTPEQRQAFRNAQLSMVFYELRPGLESEAELQKMDVKNCFVD